MFAVAQFYFYQRQHRRNDRVQPEDFRSCCGPYMCNRGGDSTEPQTARKTSCGVVVFIGPRGCLDFHDASTKPTFVAILACTSIRAISLALAFSPRAKFFGPDCGRFHATTPKLARLAGWWLRSCSFRT